MPFTPKRIFLAEDDNDFREKVKRALVAAGHQVLVEADSGKRALILVQENAERGIQVAVLDCHMPGPDDGKTVARVLNERIPHLVVASISSLWSGVWKDPNFNKENPYHPDLPSYDINGREEYTEPDLYLEWVNGNLRKFADLIGTTEFSLRREKELGELPGFVEFVQGNRRERE